MTLEPRDGAVRRVLVAVPVLAIVAVLAPYLWPTDRGPISPWSDLLQQHAPMVELLARGLRTEGELARWNPQDYGGTPTVGDAQAGVYNPIYWLLALRPSLHAFGLLIVAYAIAGAVGFMLYARALGVSTTAAAAGAILFTLGGNLLVRVALLGHTVYEPFFLVPFVLWSLHRVAESPRPRRVALAATLVALLAVSLHPQILVYCAAIFAVEGLFLAWHAARPLPVLAALAWVALLSLGLSAVHLLPTVELADEFSRGRLEFFKPDEWQPAGIMNAAWLAAAVAGPGRIPEDIQAEPHYYLGALGLVLVALGAAAWPRGHRHRRNAWFHGTLAVALLAYGAGLGTVIERRLSEAVALPLFRIPLRTLLILALPAAILASLGVDALHAAPRARRRLVAVIATVVAAIILVVAGPSPARVARLLPFALGIAGIAWLERGTTRWRHAASAVIAAALVLDTARVLAPCIATAPEQDARRLAPGLALPDDVGRATRILQLERDSYTPGIPQLVVRERRLETLGGFNSLIPWRFVLYASYAGGFNPFAEVFDVQVPIGAPEEPHLFDLLGVSHVFWLKTDGSWQWHHSPGAFPRAYLAPAPVIVPEAKPGAGLEPEVTALSRLASIDPTRSVLLQGENARAALAAIGAGPGKPTEPYRPVELHERTANRIRLEVRTERPAILVFNEPYFRGWRAFTGTTELPVLRANFMFRAVALPPGDHAIMLEFAPRSWRIGWWLSVLSVAVTAALAGLGSGRAARGPLGLGGGR